MPEGSEPMALMPWVMVQHGQNLQMAGEPPISLKAEDSHAGTQRRVQDNTVSPKCLSMRDVNHNQLYYCLRW
jgi:hypothetical protein